MQNENKAVIEEMLKSFAYLLDEALKTTTKSYDGIIISATSNSKKWNVKYNNEIHAVKMYGVGTPTANMIVKVIIPQGNQALAWFFIPGSSGGSGDGATFIPNVSESGIISWTNDKNLPNPEPVNIKGPQGDAGDIGPQGPKGDVGETGPYFIPSVSQEGVISWTNNGGLENPNEVNIKGPQGEVGPQGPIGPEGLQGPQGIQGETGATGPQGPTGPSGADATINGVNVLTIQGQNGIQVTQAGDTLTIQGEGFVFNPVGTQGQLLGFVQDNVIGAITGEYVALNKDGIRKIGYFTPIS